MQKAAIRACACDWQSQLFERSRNCFAINKKLDWETHVRRQAMAAGAGAGAGTTRRETQVETSSGKRVSRREKTYAPRVHAG